MEGLGQPAHAVLEQRDIPQQNVLSDRLQALYTETRSSNIWVGTLSPVLVATDLLIASWKKGNVQNWQK